MLVQRIPDPADRRSVLIKPVKGGTLYFQAVQSLLVKAGGGTSRPRRIEPLAASAHL